MVLIEEFFDITLGEKVYWYKQEIFKAMKNFMVYLNDIRQIIQRPIETIVRKKLSTVLKFIKNNRNWNIGVGDEFKNDKIKA